MSETRPHITAVMVTGKSVDRYPMARRSLFSFCRQDYKRRSLLIVNDNPVSLFEGSSPPDSNVDELHVPREKNKLTLGALRNLAIDYLRKQLDFPTRYVVQWDDDDFSHPGRLSYQLGKMREAGKSASIFKWEINCHLQKKKAFANCGKVCRVSGFAGTMMWPLDAEARFPDAGTHEDTDFVLALRKEYPLAVIDNDPRMYLRFYHGHNTWSETHVMRRKRGSRDLSPKEQEWFETVYERHYEALREQP